MYKYYLESLSPFKPEQVNSLLESVKRLSHTMKKLTLKISSSINFLETLIGKVLRVIENKSEKEQKKLVEYLFIAHKVLLGAFIATLYFLTS